MSNPDLRPRRWYVFDENNNCVADNYGPRLDEELPAGWRQEERVVDDAPEMPWSDPDA